jgi:hypothetical protein
MYNQSFVEVTLKKNRIKRPHADVLNPLCMQLEALYSTHRNLMSKEATILIHFQSNKFI